MPVLTDFFMESSLTLGSRAELFRMSKSQLRSSMSWRADLSHALIANVHPSGENDYPLPKLVAEPCGLPAL